MEPALPTETDRRMLDRAILIATRAAEAGEVPVGAVVYRGAERIAEAHNLREAGRDPTAHAEILAIRAAAQRMVSWRLTDCSIAVTLEPCPMCAGALVNARVARLVYGAADPKAGYVRTLGAICEDPRLNHRVEVIPGVEAARCGRLLSDFFAARR